MKLPIRMSLLLMFVILALLAAACGTSDEQPVPTVPIGGSAEPSALPPNPNPGDTPAVAGACAEGEPAHGDGREHKHGPGTEGGGHVTDLRRRGCRGG